MASSLDNEPSHSAGYMSDLSLTLHFRHQALIFGVSILLIVVLVLIVIWFFNFAHHMLSLAGGEGFEAVVGRAATSSQNKGLDEATINSLPMYLHSSLVAAFSEGNSNSNGNSNSSKELVKKRAYVCPEPSCVHHHPSRALGDLTGIKKHYSRKHGEKKWMCEKCSKIYAVHSDWKAHTKTCGTREYKCHCGALFSRKDSFITHRAFCDALAEESARLSANSIFTTQNTPYRPPLPLSPPPPPPPFFPFTTHHLQQLDNNPTLTSMYNPNNNNNNPWNASVSSHLRNPNPNINIKPEAIHFPINSTPFNYHPNMGPSSNFQQVQNLLQTSVVPQLSATALLQRASSLGAHSVGHMSSTLSPLDNLRNLSSIPAAPPVFGTTWLAENSDQRRLTRDFLGLTGEQCIDGTGAMGNNVDVNVNVNMRGVLSFTGRVEFPAYNERNISALATNNHQNFGYFDPNAAASKTWRNC